jgi:hypothetical protein
MNFAQVTSMDKKGAGCMRQLPESEVPTLLEQLAKKRLKATAKINGQFYGCTYSTDDAG